MPLPPITGLPDDGPPELPEWFEDEWLEFEGSLDREEPPEAELYGLAPDPLAGAPDDARDVGVTVPGVPEAIGAGFTRDLPSDPPFGFAAGGPLDALAPGPALAGFTADAFDAGLGKLSDDELVGVLMAARRLSSWQAALEFTAVTELDGRRKAQARRPGSSRASEHVAEELAAALILTSRSADTLLGLSRELDRLYMVRASLRAGRIDLARAVVFATELTLLTKIEACAIAAALIRPAEKMTTSQLRAAIRALILGTCPGSKRRSAIASGRRGAGARRGWRSGRRARETRLSRAGSCLPARSSPSISA